jgi:hypothetical protein
LSAVTGDMRFMKVRAKIIARSGRYTIFTRMLIRERRPSFRVCARSQHVHELLISALQTSASGQPAPNSNK